MLNFQEAGTVNGASFFFPLELEVRLWIEKRVFFPWKLAESGMRTNMLQHPVIIFLVVCLEQEFPLLGKNAVKRVQELLLNQAEFMVFCLWPGVRAQEMEA